MLNKKTIFEEIFISYDSDYSLQGYDLIAEHLTLPVLLYKKDEHYILLNREQKNNNLKKSIGILVKNIEKVIEGYANNEEWEVFDGGIIGHLKLNLPAIRGGDGIIQYLITEDQVNSFYAANFKKVTKKEEV